MTVIRKFYHNCYQHICQKSADNGMIFLSAMDYIVLITTICIKAAKNNVQILAICIMLNHFHIEALFGNELIMTRFMNGVTSVVARAYNKHYHLCGQLFKRPFKNSPKYTESRKKDNFIYISNNPVVKKAVEKAEEYKWNLIKYIDSPNPYSEPFNPSTASTNLIELMKKVKELHENGKPVGYVILRKNLFKLSQKEQDQLVDFIISTYYTVDKEALIKMYGSYDNMLAALHAVSGSEYDISDDTSEEDYKHYSQMIRIANEEGYDVNRMRFDRNTMKDENYYRMIKRFSYEAKASEYEIQKFLHTL